MGIDELTFHTKDLLTIIFAVSSLFGLYYALRRSMDKVRNNVDDLDCKMNELDAKQKKDTQSIMEALKQQKEDFISRETLIHSRIKEVKEDQQDSHEKLEHKIDGIFGHISSISTALSELTGYIKGKEGK
jgi:chromosome segregation ATPase